MAYCCTSTTVVTPIDRIRQTPSGEFDAASIDVRLGEFLADFPVPGPTLGPPVLPPATRSILLYLPQKGMQYSWNVVVHHLRLV